MFDVSTRFVGVGRDAYCHWLPALLGGHLVRQHLELAVSEPGGDMAFRGLFFTEEHEHLDVFAVDLHETGPSGGDVHWRGAATGESRASFEGLIQIDPGAQQTHTYLQIHSMMLSPKARIDAIPSVLVSADDVSASHGGTVGELDEARSSTCRPAASTARRRCACSSRASSSRWWRSSRRAAGRAGAREGGREAGGRARGHRGVCDQSLSATPSGSTAADFPIFAREFEGRPLVYLDSGATSQKPAVVIEAVADHLRNHNANVHRGVYALAQEADAAYDGARGRVAAFTGAEPDTTIFTKNVDRGDQPGRLRLGPRARRPRRRGPDHPDGAPREHRPLAGALPRAGRELRYLEVDERGALSLQALDSELARGDVRLVAFAHVSNVLGTINPVAEMTARARAAGAVSLIDGAQAVPQMPVDVNAIGADFYAWTGHKALGPTGIGVLHGRREILEAMEPFLTGGDMIASVEFQARPGTSCRRSSRRGPR